MLCITSGKCLECSYIIFMFFVVRSEDSEINVNACDNSILLHIVRGERKLYGNRIKFVNIMFTLSGCIQCFGLNVLQRKHVMC